MAGCACSSEKNTPLPEEGMDVCKMQGHWLLAKMGKRVLRPGGLELTKQMLTALNITTEDHVVEFAPGLGVTAQMTLAKKPASYTAVEREKEAAAQVRKYLQGNKQQCKIGNAEDTGLPAESATVVYGEAMLTMHPDKKKLEIIREAFRILKLGGRYGIHEVGIIPDDTDSALQKEIRAALSSAIHIGASPATMSNWKKLFEQEGFEVQRVIDTPFHLLEPKRIIQDEGFFGALKFVKNVALNPEARKVIFGMKRAFKKYRKNLNGMTMIAVKCK